MSAPPKSPYRKMPGAGFSWKGRGRLWLAEDHVLEVSSVFITESYRRFFFQDVRALVVQRTNTRLIWTLVLGALGLIAALVAGACLWTGLSHSDEDWHVAMYFPAGFFGLAMLIFLALWISNMLLGPSCVCQVLTRNGWQTLSAPRRVGPATRAQAELAGIIQAVQGPPPAATPPAPLGSLALKLITQAGAGCSSTPSASAMGLSVVIERARGEGVEGDDQTSRRT